MAVAHVAVRWLDYLAITLALGFIWPLAIFKEHYRWLTIGSRLDDPTVPLNVLAMAIQGAVLTSLNPSITHDGNWVVDGVRFGAHTGVFIFSSAVVAEARTQRVTSVRG